jgi:hypothetical protein
MAALEGVVQLAHIARPGVCEQCLTRAGRQSRRRPSKRFPDVLQEGFAERKDIAATLTERRDVDVEHLEPIEQILAKVSALHGLSQVAVGRRNDADIGFQQPRAPQPLELALLQDAQELGLRRQTHLADFVQEQHAACRQFDLSRLGLLRTRERAAFVAEQFRFEQLLRQRGTVQRDEWAVASARRAMNEAGDDFLPGARVTADEDRGVGGGDLGRLLQHVEPFGRLADDTRLRLRVQLLGEHLHSRREVIGAGARLRDLPGRVGELLVRHRQHDVIGDAAGDGEVSLMERVPPFRQEADRHDLIARTRAHADRRPIAGGDQSIRGIRPARDRHAVGREIAEQRVARERASGHLRMLQVGKIGRRRGLDGNLAVRIVEHHGHRIVREHLVRDLGDAGKHAANVEHVGNRAKQLRGCLDIGGTPLFERRIAGTLGELLMRNRQRDNAAQALCVFEIARRIRMRPSRPEREHAKELIADAHRHGQARSQATCVRWPIVEQRRLGEVNDRWVIGPQHETGVVVRDDTGGHRTEPPEELTHIEALRERRKQLVKHVEVAGVAAGCADRACVVGHV